MATQRQEKWSLYLIICWNCRVIPRYLYQLEDRVKTTPDINTLYPQSIEPLMGVQLSDDIGEWVMDGVLVCQLVNHLHPGIITQ